MQLHEDRRDVETQMRGVFADALAPPQAGELARLLAHYRTPAGIVDFVRDVVGAEPTPYQADILRNFARHYRAAVRGPHGLGKTAIAAWVVLWGISCHGDDVKIVMTAGAWTQLTHYLTPEVKKWAQKTAWERVGLQVRNGHELLERGIKLPGREAFATASKNSALIEGAHARTVIYVFDEAKVIPASTFEAAEGAFSNAGEDTDYNAYALAISTPGEASGVFYDIHKRKPGYDKWWVRHVKLAETIAAGRVSAEWAADRKRQWGEQSPVYVQRVLGEFAESTADALIPLAWVEAAQDRWQASTHTGRVWAGCDVARMGDDKTVICTLDEFGYCELDTYGQLDTMQTAGHMQALFARFPDLQAAVDVIGVGAGVVDRLAEQELAVVGVNVSHSTKATDATMNLGFRNVRSLVWWKIREELDPARSPTLALPPDDALVGDLTAPKYQINSSGKIEVESKEAMRKRIGRSTDHADALALALYARDFGYFFNTDDGLFF